MAGISSKAAEKLENLKKYNGIEFQHQEFGDLSGLEVYEAFYRNLDPQIGRWWELDPKIEENQEDISPYESMSNDPILKSDPLGDKDGFFTSLWNGIVDAVSETAAQLGLPSTHQEVVNTVRTINVNLNPLTPAVELVTGKSVESDLSEDKPRTTSAAEAALFLIPGVKVGEVLVKVEEQVIKKVVEKPIIKTGTGTEIKGFVGHGVHQAVTRRVKPAEILDALKKPLKVNKVVVDELGRPSQRYIGKKAEVAVNTETGKIVSVNPTSTKKARRLIKKAAEQ